MDVIPLVAQEIVARYHKQAGDRPMGSAITVDLAALLTRLWLLKERDRFDDAGDVAASVLHIEALADDVLDYLLHRCSLPSLATLSLQVRCDTLRRSREEQQHKAEVKKEAIRVQLEGALMSMEPGMVSAEQVWNSLAVCFVHHYSDLGSLASATAKAGSGSSGTSHSETLSAVSAALPRAQVTAFLRQDRVERAGQLRQLRRIAWGLRLYQKETGRAAGMDLMSLSTTVDTPLAELEAKAEEAVAELEPRVRLSRALLVSPTCPLGAAAQQQLKEEYHHLLLVQHVLRHVQCGLQQLRECINSRVMQPYASLLAELRQLMPASKAAAAAQAASSAATSASSPAAAAAAPGGAAPKKVVFPKFMELADAYEAGMRCAGELALWSTLLRVATESAAGYDSTLPRTAAEEALALAEAAPAPPVTSASALAAEVGALLDSDATRQRLPPGVHVRYRADLPLHTVDPTVARVYPESLCAMRGYCPVQLLAGRPTAGLLIPGQVPSEPSSSSPSKTSLGCMEVSGSARRVAMARPLYFIFADATAMRAFAADPWRYVEGCLHLFHAADPCLTLVMGRADELPRELYLEGARVVERLTSDLTSAQHEQENRQSCGTQTGQIDSYIDHNYFWNEWDLRRHALKLANLMQMRTHSSQTAALHFRREAATQADPRKESEAQTLHNAATQPPHVAQYLKGLRGTYTSAIEQVRKVIEH
ncbi:protein of unknown function - conserved [Leishmania donovani]|uniref:Cilia- and flagella-associated protein 206 n=3 Tax=Leishmania donovani species complex TaxID=38574 RepID=A0A6L0X1J3_LEIIN|nr:hypothetical_protein_-_conserved [Leishmania infantum]CAJ1987806.1 protein of unknown function - conserved [Leishmania donovani]SUZ40789.1 hypothetical_protein_-_conserved [Leishmania infantum]VDZ43693.1 hypothetical_protein_conserved [Leishmania donovani]